MLELNSEPGRPLLVAKASGLVRADDYQVFMPEFDKLTAENRRRGLLFDWTELEGWDEEAESVRFCARLAQSAKLNCVAVLADIAMNSEVRRLQEVMDLPVRRFPPSDRQSALEWLESNSL